MLHAYAPRPAHIQWLLNSDPAIRWQVMRNPIGAFVCDQDNEISRSEVSIVGCAQ
jgi:hypothetical protein